jgi:cellulose synthase/poly-beta-1,6-N-acetylglucosamine synthase-like glycosyltransferase
MISALLYAKARPVSSTVDGIVSFPIFALSHAARLACFARIRKQWYTGRRLSNLEAVVSIPSIVYLIAALSVALYGANALLLAALYLRRHRHRPPQVPLPETWPVVTVQLPIYNELYVVERLIDAVACLDYPRERLQVQVLDDSTDETTRLVRSCVVHHRLQGLDIELMHRRDRRGFKAGALACGLETAHGEFVAIFDADFVPPPDFLKRTVPHLVHEPELAFVQTRWGYLNPAYSALTRAQTIALDGHFVVEHIGRNRNGLLMNFNGTAGVWRRTAIEAAGGWQDDTLTEDVDLSFRAQLAGWQALYLPEVESPAELPPQMAAFKRQQARWATGAAQCLVKLGGSLLRGQPHRYPTPSAEGTTEPHPSSLPGRGQAHGATVRLPWIARLEGLLHLSVWVAHPMSLVLLILMLPMLLGQIPMTFNLTIFWMVALGPVVAYALSQRHLYSDWKRRMLFMPVLALLGTGLALSNTLAIARGLLTHDRAFRRTPKFHVEHRGEVWAGNRYALPFQWVTVGELLLAAYALATVAVALVMGNILAVPFLLLYVGGYGYIGFHGLRDVWLRWQARPRLDQRAVAVDSQVK